MNSAHIINVCHNLIAMSLQDKQSVKIIFYDKPDNTKLDIEVLPNSRTVVFTKEKY